MALILASASPRRKELLSLITADFRVITSSVDETLPDGITPEAAVKLLARRKADDIAKTHPDDIVIGSDTVVALDGEILGKPADDEYAARMLRALSGKKHMVFTGVCVISPEKTSVFTGSAAVKFAEMSEDEIEEYVKSGECRDKAGAYGIQGFGSRYIEYIEGDYYSVMGLPVRLLYKELRGLKM